MHTTHKDGSGQYKVCGTAAADGRTVTVTYFEHLRGWVAAADWDRYLYTDAVPTKRDAVREAHSMLDGDHDQFGMGA